MLLGFRNSVWDNMFYQFIHAAKGAVFGYFTHSKGGPAINFLLGASSVQFILAMLKDNPSLAKRLSFDNNNKVSLQEIIKQKEHLEELIEAYKARETIQGR